MQRAEEGQSLSCLIVRRATGAAPLTTYIHSGRTTDGTSSAHPMSAGGASDPHRLAAPTGLRLPEASI
eukprot:CAMPEP_0184709256 /NCGR_PEP_ID=MMETSP0314-20130426/445_1 /TAXON_ID=38298 /ORGANISM="Rhodella maculata, Strain CCMP 736" /LENGTH=67 /DNA_ID=CAMNT_0027170931 /DNA_START=1 /DNA_END=204 /DNA_ORIENTATION=+